MSGDAKVAPIIIKRKKVSGGGGHHGGAWKVAYADFVTAMMAFFLLMWLLNATTEKQRKGIADYFTPTIAVARVSGGGDGALGGQTVFAENVLSRVGTGATSLRAQNQDQSNGGPSSGENTAAAEEEASDEEKEAQNQQLKQVEEAITQLGQNQDTATSRGMFANMSLEITDEGLVIEIFDSEELPLFEDDGDPSTFLEDMAFVVAEASKLVKNKLAIEAHTAAYPVVLAQDPAWEITGARADIFRELLIGEDLAPKRVQRVTAYADREPSRPNPMDVRNNRIEVIFLR